MTEDQWEMWEQTGILPGGWELLATVDHGLRTADETMLIECAYVGAFIMEPLLLAMGCYGPSDAWGAVCEAVAPYDGEGWVEPTDDDPGAERVHWLHDDIAWRQTWNRGVDGFHVETSSDAGMTWIIGRVGK